MKKIKSKTLEHQKKIREGRASLPVDDRLEQFSYTDFMNSSHDKDGKFILDNSKKGKKSKCPFGRKIVGSMFFRSIVYNVDSLLATAEDILVLRRRDLEEFKNYVEDEQVEDDEDYRQELGKEIIYWVRMVNLYKSIKENKTRWYKEGKFPWSGYKVSTPYFGAPPTDMRSTQKSNRTQPDKELTPVNADAMTVFDYSLNPVSKESNGLDSKARRASGNRKSSSRSKRSRV
jgi:hypothetical protein